MLAALVDVDFRGHARLAQRQIEQHAVFGRNARVAVGVKQKRRWSLGRYLRFVREAGSELWIGIVAQQVPHGASMRVRCNERDDRITEDHEVRPRAGPVDRLGRVRQPGVKMRSGRGR